jgi:drug/metabolite transporter (DMT)-like permease
MQSPSVSESTPHLWSGLLLVIAGAVLLSAKGILSKLLYAEGFDFQEVITIRAALSLPLFWMWGIYAVGLRRLLQVDSKSLSGALAAGFLCYYFGGTLDFYALTMIDAGLERVLLYTYPAIIVMSLALWRRQLPRFQVIAALILTYIGILLAIGVFDMTLLRANVYGSMLVLISALTLATYFFANDFVAKKIGSIVFTVYAMSAATFALCVHYSLNHAITDLDLSFRSWWLFLLLVVFVNVVPLFMLAEGVKQIGAQRAGLISTVGPASTILLAAIFLGEEMLWFQYAGVVITLSGIMILEWQQKQLPPISD